MATNKNATIRYRTLDKCFRDFRHRYFIEDLIDECEEALESFNFTANVSRRQIFDDIRFMESDAGWEIPLARLHDGKRVYYRYENSSFTINKQPLTDAEAQQIQSLILTLSRFRGLPCNEWVDEVISSLEYRFHLKGTNENVISFEQNENLKGIDKLTDVLNATSNHQVLRVLYHNFKNGGRDIEYLLHPYFVKQYNNRWFLFGKDNRYNNLVNLALDRIVCLKVEEGVQFIPNQTIDFECYFDDVVGVTIPKDEVRKQHIIMKFSEHRFPYVVSKPIHRSQEIVSQEERLISIDVRPNLELESQILSFGPDVEIISPEAFRQQISRKIEENYQKYFSVQNGCTDES